MNIYRKVMGHSKASNSTTTSIPESTSDNSLGLTHLRKLFAEFRHPSGTSSAQELEEKLYNMLPLFCKVFGNSPSSEMTEKFGDILQFCSHVSRLMSAEIRRRASNQSTEAASCAIAQFLEIESSEETSNGWMLLTTINLLTSGGQSLIDCMTVNSLPSTLVKCLYLFFDLPDVDTSKVSATQSQFSPLERRVLLQKIFVQVLVRLCSYPGPAEELARRDDLTLLFSAITSWCPAHNVAWRKSSAEVLMTLSRHGLTPSVVQYIHSKGCVSLCIDNMKRSQELAPLELVEMFVTVFCFLKDSSEVSQVLLDDFRSCQGYIYLSEFLLRLELDLKEESMQALRNLVLLVGSLTTCGFTELKPNQASSGSLFQMPGFSLPSPAGKGISVRNLQAFQVLQSVFIKAQSGHLCSILLDVISSIYHQDNANYFILEPENTLSQFAERIHLKPAEIQIKFFEIFEFVIFHLNFVPCKELISLSLLIKTQNTIGCSTLCIKSLLKIVRYQTVFKDVFREVGLLEVIVTCLHRYAALFKDPPEGVEKAQVSDEQQILGNLVMEALSILLNGNNSNAAVFRECGGARCALNMVPYPDCRQQVLRIVQQLIVSTGGDDDMGTLLGLMHSAPVEAVELKTQILKSLLNILRESHRTRTVFRKVGGFVYVMSVLVSMEGCLAEPPKGPWEKVDRKAIVSLLKTVFNTLTVAMRYEPANAKFFATDVHYASLTDAVRLLGCFCTHSEVQFISDNVAPSEDTVFTDFFNHTKEHRIKRDIPKELLSACLMIRFLYDMALDNFDFKFTSKQSGNSDSPHLKRMTSVFELPDSSPRSSPLNKRASLGSINLKDMHTPAAIVVHAGAVTSILHLLPGITCKDNKQMELDLQFCIAKVLKSVMKTERNQQVMCDAGLPHELLTRCKVALEDETHPLHPPLQYIFERLAAQSLTAKDLRDFLRLSSPLSCSAIDAETETTSQSTDVSTSAIQRVDSTAKRLKTDGGAVPLTRVKCLVSMTTPRDVRLHGASVTPAFVEFEMNVEGFGCLYLPSMAPQGPPTPSVVGVGMVGNTDNAVIGGIGTGERLFPPQSGLSFSSWICVDKFSQSTPGDSHPARLLSIVRNIQGREDNLICLSVLLNPRDKSLNISTQETQLPNTAGSDVVEYEPIFNDSTVRIWCPELTQEGQWRHMVLVFHRAGIMKNSSVSLFLDGSHIQTQKLHYISPNIGAGGSASAQSVTSVYACIGTLPALRKASSLTWKQGPCHLFEDIISPTTVETLYKLGPNYVGSFQAPILEDGTVAGPMISEDKIIFGIHAHALSLMTIAKIKKIYNKIDSKTIARQLSMSPHENATPIRILHNSAGHLAGPARTLGAVLIGYLGVRTFNPKPVASMLDSVGGTSALLGLIAMATDVEGLYAAVKALVCVVRSTDTAPREMDRTRGYQTLAMLYKKKRHLLNSHILHLTFSLVGTVDSGRESTTIPNRMAFEDLLCDLEVWHEAPGDLQKSLYEHFYELLTESSEHVQNHKLMREAGLVAKLLHIFHDLTLSNPSTNVIASVLTVLLQGIPEQENLLKFGQFIVSTLPTLSVSERGLAVDDDKIHQASDTSDGGGDGMVSARKVKIRNICLDILLKLMYHQNNTVNQHISDEIQHVLGFDWLMLFMQEHLHSSTVVLSMRIVLAMLGNAPTMSKFREGTNCGSWLGETEAVLQDRVGILLESIKKENSTKNQNREINEDVCHLPGYTALQWLLSKHAHIPELYFLLIALLLGQPVKETPKNVQFDLDSVWTFIFGVPASQPVSMKKSNKAELCPEAANVILSMVRFMLSQQWQTESEGSWLREYPITLSQFFIFLYHNHTDFPTLCMSGEFLQGLASAVFPIRASSESDSELSSPMEEVKVFAGCEPLLVVKSVDKVWTGKTGNLSSHPAKKFVMDFLRSIVVDSLSLPVPRQSAPVIDMLLEVTPEHATTRQQREFQTEILKSLMDHLLAADALLGEEAALPIFSSGSYSNMANNVFYFASRVVDKLWQGTYVRESMEVFEFVSQLIAQAKRKSSGLSLDSIYKSLNRTILYHLSRPIYSVADQTMVLEALHKLTSNRNLVFGPGNYDQEFIGCLSYCLLQLTEDVDFETREARFMDASLSKTTWHVDQASEIEADLLKRSDSTCSEEGQQLLANAAKRVWEELYVHKKPALEEIFKVSISSTDSSGTTKMATPDLMSVRSVIQEPATRVWSNYVDGEKRNSLKDLEKIQYQLQSKLQKVGSGVLRLARRPTKKEAPVRTVSTTPVDCVQWTFTHVSIVKDLVDLQHRQYLLGLEHMEKYLLNEWSQVETELMRERGLWGPPNESALDKWMLDMTEGPHRMRKKMIRNELFYIHYPHRPEKTNGTLRQKSKGAVSHDSQKYYERYRSRSLVGDQEIPDLLSSDDFGVLDDADDVCLESEKMDLSKAEVFFKSPCILPRPSSSNKITNDLEEWQDTDLVSESSNSDADKPDTSNQTVLRLLEEGEKINHMFRCARIEVLDTAEGLLLFGKEHFYVIDGFTLLKSKEIVDIDTLPPDHHEPIIPMTTTSSQCQKRMCNKFAYEDIREVHKRRYLLQPLAIEVFSADGRNFLLAFPRKIRNKIYARFMAVATAITDNAHQSVSGQKQNAKVEQGTGLISSLIGEKSVTQRWERGEISNFQYLMYLNTLAGRSYNDLMQYPVFPWILANYDSEELELTDPANFRDLSRPMGAQTDGRLAQFRKRYKDWDDPQGETPPYHYGTHYSSAMIVASYLVRMEPFTQIFLKLQGGHFDLADRMFHSVKENWMSASKNNMADVKELIPEFFYLPEFLLNANKFDLGAKQSGVHLGDVVLPTWAKGDPQEFIRGHREALECDYVSAHLNEWIDLIFGYKQQGPPAAEAVNVFHHLFYEGNVDIYSIDDPLKKNATIGFINNFGQIPKQLFKKPHPQKKVSLRLLDPVSGYLAPNSMCKNLFFHHLDNLQPTMQPIKELRGEVGQILATDKLALAVEQNKVILPSSLNRYVAWGFSDLSLRIGAYDSERISNVFENVDSGEVLCAACPNGKTIITAGTSCVVKVWSLNTARANKNELSLKQPLYGHTEPVTCVTASSAYNVIVSGSRDRSCIIWDMSRLVFVKQLRGHSAPVAAVAINEITGDIASCAGTYLHVWTINGDVIASINAAATETQQILCVAMSQMMEWDNHNVIMTGSSDGVVRMWSVEFVQVPDENKLATIRESEQTANKVAKEDIMRRSLEVFKNPEHLLVEGGNVEKKKLTKSDNVTSQEADLMSFDEDSDSKSGDVSMDSASEELVTDGDKGESVATAEKVQCVAKTDETMNSDNPPSVRLQSERQISTSSTGSDFVVIGENEVSANAPPVSPASESLKKIKRRSQMLREGFKWQKQLVFKSKLTMHTAFERKDNKHPSAVTALAISKDHKTVYVGDAKGRVFSWSVTSQPGQSMADHWVKDEGAECCNTCSVKFSFSERRHHCRNCGKVFCARCSRNEIEIRRLRIHKPVRVCQTCYQQLKDQQTQSGGKS